MSEKNTPLWKRAVKARCEEKARRDNLREKARKLIDEAAPIAAQKLADSAAAGDPRAIESVLDRSLGKATQMVQADISIAPEIILEWAK